MEKDENEEDREWMMCMCVCVRARDKVNGPNDDLYSRIPWPHTENVVFERPHVFVSILAKRSNEIF